MPALFTPDDTVAADLLRHAAAEHDPLWRLPLWAPYREGLDSKVADISNVAEGPYGGAITAALFLNEFVAETRAVGAPRRDGVEHEGAPGSSRRR